MNEESSKIAIFIDVENLTKWVKEDGPEGLLDEIYSYGQPIVRRAYGNWTNSSVINFQAYLNRLGFELIHNFHPVSGKNSSDIQMTVDVIEYAWKLKDVGWFVLATGDSDFSPLFRRLREMGKGVIGVGPRSNLSETVKTSCSRYIYTESAELKNKNAIQSAYEDAIDNLEKALSILGGQASLPALKSKLLEIDSAFNEKQLGYSSFSSFLESTDDLRLDKNKNNCYSIPNNLEQHHSNSLDKKELDTLVSEYSRLLRKMKWKSVGPEILIDLYEILKHLPPLSKECLIDNLLNKAGNGITLTEVKKAFAIFLKCKLLQYTLDGADLSQKVWHINDINSTNDDMLRARDKAVIERIVNACCSTGTRIDTLALKNMAYSTFSQNEIVNIVEHSQINNNNFAEQHA